MNEHKRCFVCLGNNVDINEPLPVQYEVKCKTCGDYKITGEFIEKIPDNFNLPGVLRRLYSNGDTTLIDSQFLDNYKRGFYSYIIPNTVHDIAISLLEYIKFKSTKPSKVVLVDRDADVSLVFGSSREEIDYFIKYLTDSELITSDIRESGFMYGCTITIKGWQYLYDKENTSRNSKQCFVAMCFSEKYKDVLENAIRPAIKEAGFDPLLINEHAEKNATSEDHVDDLIISEIRKSRFMVADFSKVRPNVCFEAGFAKGLGIPVIYCGNKEFEDELPFDTEHYYHLLWEDGKYDEFKKALKQKIQAEIYS